MATTKRGPTAAPDDPVQKPNDWENVISCAYLRLTGSSQEQAAQAVGCSERQLREWEHCSWWPEAETEAHLRWLRGMDAKVRGALHRSLDDVDQYAQTARWYADRRIGELAPPKNQTELSAKGKGAFEVVVQLVEPEKGE